MAFQNPEEHSQKDLRFEHSKIYEQKFGFGKIKRQKGRPIY